MEKSLANPHLNQWVEDRLYDDSKRRDRENELKKEMADELAWEQAKSRGGDVNELVDRLYEDRQAQMDKTMTMQEKHKDNECTFRPTISYNSQRKAEWATKGKTFEERNYNREELEKKRKMNEELHQDKNCTFRPKTNKKKGKARYLDQPPKSDPKSTQESNIKANRPKTGKFEEEKNCWFKPQINPISEAITKRTGEKRWETLYKLDKKKREEEEEWV